MINVFDEAWRALAIPGIGEWLQIVLQALAARRRSERRRDARLSDLDAAGAAGSRERELAKGCSMMQRPA